MAEGFESRKDNVIKVVGQGDDLNKILNDEMLDSCDNMQTRKTIRAIFLAVFAELCRRIDEILAAMQPFIDSYLTNNLDSTVMSNMKLYPALEALRKFCQEKNKDEPVEFDIHVTMLVSILTIQRVFNFESHLRHAYVSVPVAAGGTVEASCGL